MMTREQIADRIREEYRKHAKNDPEGWPLIAAGQIRAEMQGAGVQRYYFFVVWLRDMRPHADRGWQPASGVTDSHPLHLCTPEWREGKTTQRELISWQEITKEEYDLYLRLNP